MGRSRIGNWLPAEEATAFISKVNAFSGFYLFQVTPVLYIYVTCLCPIPAPRLEFLTEYFFHRNFNNKGILIKLNFMHTINLAAITSTCMYIINHLHPPIAVIKHKSTQSK